MPKLLKQEDVDSSDDESADEYVDDNPEEVSVEDTIEGDEDTPPPPSTHTQHRGGRVINQTKPYYIQSFSCKSYSRSGGVNLSQVERINISYPNEDDFLKNGCHYGAGYKVKQGVISMNFADNA